MSSDAPLKLRIESPGDVDVLSSVTQDAVVRDGEIAWLPSTGRFVLAMRRFRWEAAARRGGLFGRAKARRIGSLLQINHALNARRRGLEPGRREPLALLAIRWRPAASDDGSGAVRFVFSGGGEVLVEVARLDAVLRDMGSGWTATARPLHRLAET